MTKPMTTAKPLTQADLESIRDFAQPWSTYVAMASELLTLRARAVYLLSHGSAWEQRVCRGELDATILGQAPPQPPTP